ncbi:type II toxin-antitoxin system RelE/ParE family toxin [Lyngbya sp. CCY1209]|jgi:mRNA interferase RelE/StbE|uniref:type II toxin-antitoxin system RelE family toxin n=1 Tax=Lyngbya sp. CCY1209 TaxID=2886103 RepID=UPI002D216220|nr:type II toxin-antitoxin system RelE/ParE family toxin [Lyngbya sp. CCY1209]MEB3882058.1 type II toxin-antitoxin system RelE/ParE family toxin [Lyngbya sp. CCY1209]
MTYQIRIPKAVQKQLQKIPDPNKQRIIENLLQMREDPRLGNAIKMKNSQGYRLRIGDYRILYDIDDANQIVTIRRIAHRREVYRQP